MRLPLSASAAASIAAHALLIAAAVLATARAAHPRPAAPERFIPLPVFRAPTRSPSPSRLTNRMDGNGSVGPASRLPSPPPTIDVPGPGQPVDAGCSYACLSGWSTGTDRAGPVAASDHPETAGAVDAQASATPGTPPPAYPPLMRDAGIGAHLTVQFIVDTTGHAGPPTVIAADVDGDARDAFLSAIRTSLARTRFRPATIADRRVRQLVQQQFDFVPLR